MKKYFVKTPWWLKRIYSGYTWSLPTKEKIIYLTFDDGPHPQATPFVLDELKRYQAKAIFFCIGKNVAAYPEIYKRILTEGHTVGNHTHNHLNGWKENDKDYFKNIFDASKYIDSDLFRPPYGKISTFQAKQVIEKMNYKIVMWSVLSGDFDKKLSAEDCVNNVKKGASPGSIIVFHDSEKCFSKLRYILPKTLEFFAGRQYQFENLKSGDL